MPHMYSNHSNAKAAAKKVVEKYPTLIAVSHPVRAPGLNPMFYAAVTPLAGVTVDTNDDDWKAIAEKAKLLSADEHAEANAADRESEAAHKASQGGKAPARKAKAGKAPRKHEVPPKKASANRPAPAPKPKKEGKGATALRMMSRTHGATGEELQKALDWLPHTVRGFVSNENRLNTRGIETVREQGKPTRYVLKTK